MLRISEKNWEEKAFWKPFEEWVTALRRKYQGRIIFGTQWRIITFHVFYVTVTVVVIMGLIQNTQDTLLNTISMSVERALEGEVVYDNLLLEARDRLFTIYLWVFVGLIVFSGVFGYVATQIALRPTREAFRTQKRFIANIAHELRTPLALLKTSNEVALLEAHHDPHAQVFENNVIEIDKITDTLNNLLSITKLDSTNTTFSREDVSLNVVVRDVVSKLRPLADSRSINFVVAAPPVPHISGNAVALEQVVYNIVSNAICYTPEEGIVRVTTSTDDAGGVVLTVSDSGMGIKESELKHVFEPFFRTDPARSRRTGGTGLGLSIVLEIVKLHEGKIDVESVVNQGTTVRIVFPQQPRNIRPKDDDTSKISFDFSPKKSTRAKKS